MVKKKLKVVCKVLVHAQTSFYRLVCVDKDDKLYVLTKQELGDYEYDTLKLGKDNKLRVVNRQVRVSYMDGDKLDRIMEYSPKTGTTFNDVHDKLGYRRHYY